MRTTRTTAKTATATALKSKTKKTATKKASAKKAPQARRPVKFSKGADPAATFTQGGAAVATGKSNFARQPPTMAAQDVFPAPPGNNPPLDYKVPYSAELVKRYPKVFFAGGDMDSHLELETKWKVDLKDIDLFRKKLDALVSDPKLLLSVLGKGWSVTPNLKYVGSPMIDKYDDDPATLSVTRDHGVVRDRSVEGDRYNNINVKPDGGQKGATVFDPVIRTEYDIAVNKEVRDDPGLLNGFIGSGEHLDVFRFIPTPIDAAKLKVVSDISDIRAKFNFDHESGLAIEASLDNVTWKTEEFLDKSGKPMVVKYGQIEMEKEHQAFGGNSPTPAATTAAAAPAPADDDPLAFLRGAGPVSIGGPARIHTPTDQKSPAARKTPDYGLQVEFNRKIAAYLYGAGVEPKQAEQKNYTGFVQAATEYNDPRLKKLLGL